jgi:hypothetical protein
MNTGDQLKDVSFDMDVDNHGLKSTVSMVISDRKVAGKESVTTTAGTWDCLKITYNSKITIKTMGIGVPIKDEGTEWFAPGFGVVKTEGKHGGTAITSIK